MYSIYMIIYVLIYIFINTEQIFNMEGVRIKELGIQRPSWQCQTLDDDDSRYLI